MIHIWNFAAHILGQQPETAEAVEPAYKPYWIGASAALILLVAWKRKSLPTAASPAIALFGLLGLLYGVGSPWQPVADRWAIDFWSRFGELLTQPLIWALLFGGLGLILMLPVGTGRQQMQGAIAGIVSLGFFAASVPTFADFAGQAVFGILAAVTLVSAAATISMRSPVYSAIWFALSLLGTAGLFFYQGSQFLGVATVVVYAGAIVVTFLFVVMLAQPEGHATYDRLTWGTLPKPISVIAAAVLVGCLAYAVSGSAASRKAVTDMATPWLDLENSVVGVAPTDTGLMVTVRSMPENAKDIAAALTDAMGKPVTLEALNTEHDVLHPSHMARLGAQMFTRQLLSVELAGTLLLVALVGAISMAIQGKNNDPPRTIASATEEEAS